MVAADKHFIEQEAERIFANLENTCNVYPDYENYEKIEEIGKLITKKAQSAWGNKDRYSQTTLATK